MQAGQSPWWWWYQSAESPNLLPCCAAQLVDSTIFACILIHAVSCSCFLLCACRVFYNSIPSPVFVPIFIISVMAAIVASQATNSDTCATPWQQNLSTCHMPPGALCTRTHSFTSCSKAAAARLLPGCFWCCPPAAAAQLLHNLPTATPTVAGVDHWRLQHRVAVYGTRVIPAPPGQAHIGQSRRPDLHRCHQLDAAGAVHRCRGGLQVWHCHRQRVR